MDSGATNFMIFAVLIIVLLFIYVFSNRVVSTNNQITEPPKDVSGEFNPVSVKKDGTDLGNVIGDLYNYAGSPSVAKDDIDGKSSSNIGGSTYADEPKRRGEGRRGGKGKGGGRYNDVDDSNVSNDLNDSDASNDANQSGSTETSKYSSNYYQTTTNSSLTTTISSLFSTTFQPYGFTRPAPVSSNSQTPPSKTKNGYYKTTPTPTSLTSYSNTSKAATTRNSNLSTNLSPYKYLGDIALGEPIESGTNEAKFKATTFPLTLGLYIKVEDDYYKIVNIESATNNKGKNSFVVEFDESINADVDADEMLSVYFTISNGATTTPSRITTTPFGDFATTPVNVYANRQTTSASDTKNTYLLHLPQSSKINSSLVFKPYSELTDSELKVISSLIVHTPENFGEETTEAPIDPSLDATLPPLDMSDPSLDATLPPLDMSDPSFDTTSPSIDTTSPSFDVTEPPIDVTEPPLDSSLETTYSSYETTYPSNDPSLETTYSSYETTYPSNDPSLETTYSSYETTYAADDDEDASSIAATMSSFATTMSSLVTTFPPFTTTPKPDFNSCGSTGGSADGPAENVPVTNKPLNRNKKLSALYITDCLSYPIYTSVYRNGSLIVQLKTDDERTINSGYYKLVI